MKVRLDHVNINVADLRKSVEWYGKVFRFRVVERGTSHGKDWVILANNDSMICMSEVQGLMPANENTEERNYQIFHFGLRIGDLNQWQSVVREQNLKIEFSGEVQYPHSTSWYVLDPSGHEIEVSYASSEQLQFPKEPGFGPGWKLGIDPGGVFKNHFYKRNHLSKGIECTSESYCI